VKKKRRGNFSFSRNSKGKKGKKVKYGGMSAGQVRVLEKLSGSISAEELRSRAVKSVEESLNQPLEGYTKDLDSLVELGGEEDDEQQESGKISTGAGAATRKPGRVRR
jgi:hypothetical protein